MKRRQHSAISLRELMVFGILVLFVNISVSACFRDNTDRSPVTLQNLADGTAIKAVPVYPDEIDTDARERLLASVECTPYHIVDEGTSTWRFSESKAGENYYRYMKYRCTEAWVG